jgi:hypothetical protein
MGLQVHEHEFDAAERRTSVRYRVSCPVQLQLPSGQRIGCMVDMSERGARIEVDDPPRQGASVMLEWMCYDVICQVVWATEDACGLRFEKELSPARVLEVQQYREEFMGPIAEVSNIPLGRRRSRSGAEP